MNNSNTYEALFYFANVKSTKTLQKRTGDNEDL